MQPPPRKATKASVALRAIHGEQLTKLQSKHQQECDLLEDLRNFTQKRSTIEKQYAESLLKLSTSFLHRKIPTIPEIKSADGQDHRTVFALWRTLLDENEKLARARLAAADVFHHRISESVKTLKINKVHAAKKCFEQLQKVHEEVQLSVRELDKSKKIYFEDEHFAHDARDKAHDAEEKLKRKKGNLFQSISSMQKNSAKFSNKRESCDVKSTFARNEYLLHLTAASAHQSRYFDVDLPEIIKILDSEAYERVTEFIQLLSRTELLTCAATQSSYSKIMGMAELNTRQYNLDCFMNEFPVMKGTIEFLFEPCEGDKVDFISTDHSASLTLSKEAKKWASRYNKEGKNIRENNKQLKQLLSQVTPGQRHDSTTDQTAQEMEQKIDELKLAIRKAEGNRVKAQARLESLRLAGVNVEEWMKTPVVVDAETLGPQDAVGGSLSRCGSQISIKTDISGNVEYASSEAANDSFYDSDFNDASSDLSGGITGGILTQGTPEKTRKVSQTDSLPDAEATPGLTNGDGSIHSSTVESSENASASFGDLRAIALYNYQAQNPDELTILENEQLEIIGEGDGDGWVKARNEQGEEGYIPQNYVEVEGGQAVPSSIEPAPVSFSSVDYDVPVSQVPPTLSLDLTTNTIAAPGQEGAAREMYCRGLYDYEATCPEEISFVEGQLIRVVRKEVSEVDDGWWEGEVDGHLGIFPSLVVEELTDSEISPEGFVSPPGSAPPTFTPPPMPPYLLPPAQLIITQPTPMKEENPITKAVTQASAEEENGNTEASDEAAYSQLVSSPETPAPSPLRSAPLPPVVKVQDHNDNEECITSNSEDVFIMDIPTIVETAAEPIPPEDDEVEEVEEVAVESAEILDHPPPGFEDTDEPPVLDGTLEGAGDSVDLGGGDGASLDNLSQTDTGSTPSNATVVDLALNSSQDEKADDDVTAAGATVEGSVETEGVTRADSMDDDDVTKSAEMETIELRIVEEGEEDDLK